VSPFSLAVVPVPRTSPPRFLLVRPLTEDGCHVELYEQRNPEVWRQEVVELSPGRRSWSMSLMPVRGGCQLAIETRSSCAPGSTRALVRYLHVCADAWLHNVDLVARGQLEPSRAVPLGDLGPRVAESTETVSASRGLPHPPERLWQLLVGDSQPPTGATVHRLWTTREPVTIGSVIARVSRVDDRLVPSLHAVTALREPSLLTLRRLDGRLPGETEWHVDATPEGSVVTLVHRGPASPAALERGLDSFQDLSRLPIS
jgi:hypothetical protein